MRWKEKVDVLLERNRGDRQEREFSLFLTQKGSLLHEYTWYLQTALSNSYEFLLISPQDITIRMVAKWDFSWQQSLQSSRRHHSLGDTYREILWGMSSPVTWMAFAVMKCFVDHIGSLLLLIKNIARVSHKIQLISVLLSLESTNGYLQRPGFSIYLINMAFWHFYDNINKTVSWHPGRKDSNHFHIFLNGMTTAVRNHCLLNSCCLSFPLVSFSFISFARC